MGGDLRQVGGDFLAKALDPEGPPPSIENPVLSSDIRVHRAGSQQKILFTKEIIKHFDKLLQYRQEHILLFGLNGDNNLRQIVN